MKGLTMRCLTRKAWAVALAMGSTLGVCELAAQKNRVAAIDRNLRTQLTGHIHPNAKLESDLGRVPVDMPIDGMTLVLALSPTQETDLASLLAAQQDPNSPDFRVWLTPEQYADRFGYSQSDLDRITAWLQGEQLEVISTGRGRTGITFRGTASHVERAFRTQIHHYDLRGTRHFANSTEPSVPTALSGMVTAIRGLHDFRMQARAKPLAATPRFNNPSNGRHQLAPDDIATIYDLKPLYAAGIDGTGQKIAVVGQTAVDLADIRNFRTNFNLPANDPQVLLVPGLVDPGTSQSDLGEADLDIEWTGAVARKATIVYVYSNDVTDALAYAIDQNLAPVISMSYGFCELPIVKSELNTLQNYARRGNTQGITWIAASGDFGAADCYGSTRQTGLAVDVPASIPEVTGVGGTEFNESSGSYWNTTNDANLASATGYIPEMVWNDPAGSDGSPSSGGGGASAYFAKPVWQTGLGVPSDGFRDVPDISFSASAAHDGYRVYTQGNFSTFGGTSVAAPVFAGMTALLNQYQVANGFQTTSGQGNLNTKLYSLAVSAPNAFHDVTVGNNMVNPCTPRATTCVPTPIGYSATPGYDLATGLGSLDGFNFVTAWNQSASKNVATLTASASAKTISVTGSVVLTATVAGSGKTVPTGSITFFANGVPLGTAPLSAGAATLTVQGTKLGAGDWTVYAQYSGDATYGVNNAGVSLSVTGLTVSMAASSSVATVPRGGTVILTVAFTTSGTTSTPTGTIKWFAGGSGFGTANIKAGTLSTALTVPGSSLPTGPITLTANYSGDSLFAATSATVNVTVVGPKVDGIGSAASGRVVGAPGMIASMYGTQLGTSTASAAAIPLPTSLGGAAITVNGVPAPLFFVSPTQINFQIPYGTANGSAAVAITSDGQTVTTPMTIAFAAPGLFTQSGTVVPDKSAKRGQMITLYITGEGASKPLPTTGSTPAAGTIPTPTQLVGVLVGGVAVSTDSGKFFIGIPGWSVGVTQINCTIPDTSPLGVQPVTVIVGGVSSPLANIVITQ